MKIKLMAWLGIAILSGCSATGDDYIRGQTPTVLNHPVLGSLTVAERELLGPDVNQNGIRDDIDVVISKLSAERRPDISRHVLQITRNMIIGSRGISNAVREIPSTTDVSSSITNSEKNSYLELVTNTSARKASFTAWQDIRK